MLLQDIEVIACALKTEKSNKIQILHKLLFNDVGDRKNRSRIRTFSGFNFKTQDDAFKQKVDDTATNFSLLELISIANILRLDIDGSQQELSERIILFLTDLESLKQQIEKENINSDSEHEEISNSVENKEIKNSTPTVHSGDSNIKCLNSKICTDNNFDSYNIRSPTVTFHDVEHIIPKYSGEKHENIQLWLDKFDSFCYSFHLNDVQKFIFAERALGGIASLFVRSESNIHSFEKLKDALLAEFSSQINSAEVHEMLSHRFMKEKESLFEYFLIMKELASRANIDDNALIRYVINGINDSPQNKCILYDCKNLSEFKHKLKVYDEISQNMKKVKSSAVIEKNFKPQKSVPTQIRCFNCGRNGHKSAVCRDKQKGLKCFKCNSFGHKASDNKCVSSSQNQNLPVNKLNLKQNSQNEMHKLVKLSGVILDALIDTGSYVTLLREDVFHQINLTSLTPVTLKLTGFGNNDIQPLGSFFSDIDIDGEIFSTNVYVIAKHQMSLPLILGTDIITQGILCYDKNGISLTKPVKENLFVHLVNTVEDPLGVDLTHIVNKQCKQEVANLISSYKPNKTQHSALKMTIVLKDDIPVCQRARRISVTEKKIVSDQIQQYLKDGIIKPSCSDYASPIVLVKKKDNSVRLCVDYRKLNKKIVKDHYPLPLIDDVLDQLQNATVFTSIDLKNGFFHVDIDPNSTKFTSFITHNGQYEFLKVPFGLSISPAVFNRFLASVFRDLLADGTLILYMDDFIIPSKSEEEGLAKLKRVLSTASSYGLDINFKKCQFLTRKVEFLGHIIENNTISPSPAKIKAVKNFPEPKTVKHLQSFLGLAGYFRKYISGYACIAKPLSDLLRKSSHFNFGPAERAAFLTLKEQLTKEPVLRLFVPGSELEVHTDASKFGFGAVLLQKCDDNKLHPVLYMSRKTSPQEEKLHSYELEVLAVIEALKKFRVYLHGTKFKLVTDCEAFQKTMDKSELSAKIARWALFLQDFDFNIVHRSGNQMKHVDALSRYPVNIVTHDELTHKIVSAQSTDDFISSLKQTIEHSPQNDFFVKNGVLYKLVQDRELLVVPQAMQNQIIQDAHAKGHFSVQKTVDLVQQTFYIPNLVKLTETVILNCVPCILASKKSGKKEGFLHPIPKGDVPLDTYHVDFLGPLPSTNKQYKHLFTVTDAFSKFIWIYPVKSTSAQDALDKLQLQQTMFGNPRRIISDKGPAFTSDNFQSYCKDENIEYVPITTGVPRGNGQIERMHKTLIPVLTKLSLENPNKWYKHVSKVQRILNSTKSQATHFSPFELMFGIKMKNKEDTHIKEILEDEYLKATLQNQKDLRDIAKNNILKHQEQNKRYYDKRRKPSKTYKLGDLVAIQRTQFGPGLKLKLKYFGPYKIKSIKNNDRFEVEKVGCHEGPHITSTAADMMKPWSAT